MNELMLVALHVLRRLLSIIIRNNKKSNRILQTVARTCFEWCILCGVCVLVCYVVNNSITRSVTL